MYSAMKIIKMNNCCLNIGSKVRLKLGPACNTPIATSNLQRIHISVSIPAVRSQSSTSVKHTSPNHLTNVRKECDLWGAQQLFTKTLILSFLFNLPTLCSLSSHSLDLFSIKLCSGNALGAVSVWSAAPNLKSVNF